MKVAVVLATAVLIFGGNGGSGCGCGDEEGGLVPEWSSSLLGSAPRFGIRGENGIISLLSCTA